MTRIKISSYNSSVLKKLFDYLLGFILFSISLPLMAFICLFILVFDSGPVIFRQKRVGKGGKVFTIYKFRTMREGAESQRDRLLKLNEVDGPVFKIYNDPRYTKTARILARTGLDELPQLLNVLKGEMSLVGPRPLPTYEAKFLTKKQRIRELVKPGITSSWIVKGAHSLKFKAWMDLDQRYVYGGSLGTDLSIIFQTAINMARFLYWQLLRR